METYSRLNNAVYCHNIIIIIFTYAHKIQTMYNNYVDHFFPPQPQRPFTNPEIPSLLVGSVTDNCFLNVGNLTKFNATSKNNGLQGITSISVGLIMFGSLLNILASS